MVDLHVILVPLIVLLEQFVGQLLLVASVQVINVKTTQARLSKLGTVATGELFLKNVVNGIPALPKINPVNSVEIAQKNLHSARSITTINITAYQSAQTLPQPISSLRLYP